MKGYKWIEDKAQWDSAEVTIQMLIYQLDSAKTSDQVIISKNDTYQYLGDNTYLINQKFNLPVYDKLIIKITFYDDNSGEIYMEGSTLNNIFVNIPYFKGTITRQK